MGAVLSIMALVTIGHAYVARHEHAAVPLCDHRLSGTFTMDLGPLADEAATSFYAVLGEHGWDNRSIDKERGHWIVRGECP